MKEWPKMLYRPAAAGGIEHRSFASEAAIPADEGWTDFKTAKAAAKPAPPAPSAKSAATDSLQKQIAELSQKLIGANAQVATERAAAEQSRAAAQAASARAAELEKFLRDLEADPGSPAALRVAIKELLLPEEEKAARLAKAAVAKRQDKADDKGKRA